MVTTRSAAQSRGSPAVSLAQAVANLQAAYGTTSAGEPAAVSSQHAAVLVPLFFSPEAGEVHVVLTQRSGKLNTHAGEVCFPGGKREAGDADDAATALREAHEELGIDPGAVTVVASLPPVLSKHLLSVRPVVGTVAAGLRVSPNPDEVAHVFTAPLRMFLEAGPGYSHRDVRWEGCPYRLHYFGHEVHGRRYTIWGLTAGLLVLVAERALGRPAEFEVSPPGEPPYTALAYEHGQLVFRAQGGGRPRTGGGATAAADGAVVMDVEVQAAVGQAAEEGSGAAML